MSQKGDLDLCYTAHLSPSNKDDKIVSFSFCLFVFLFFCLSVFCFSVLPSIRISVLPSFRLLESFFAFLGVLEL